MQIASIGDNLHEMSYLFSGENKKTILICRLLKILPRVLSVKQLIDRYFPFQGNVAMAPS